MLRAAGADERVTVLMRVYYGFTALILPLAVFEHVALGAALLRAQLVGGLILIAVGLALRFWAIQSLGSYWTMRCLGLPRLRQLNRGPYKFISDPEYLSRVFDALGFSLIFAARWTLGVSVLVTLVLGGLAAAAERRQSAELGEERRPVEAQRAS